MGVKSDAAREKIIREFHRLILEQGYKKTTLRQLARECGMSTGHVGFYFKKKEEIVIALSSRYFDKAQRIIRKCIHLNEDDFLRYAVYYLLLLYIIRCRKETHFYMADMAQSGTYLKWRTTMTYDWSAPVFVKTGICKCDDLLRACIFSTYGLYGSIQQAYSPGEAFDYKSYFSLYMKGFFAQIGFLQGDAYIDKAFRTFDMLDKKELSLQMELDF